MPFGKIIEDGLEGLQLEINWEAELKHGGGTKRSGWWDVGD